MSLLSTPKRQKLEILKEGGLIVTPISGMTNGRPTPPEKPRPSVIQHNKAEPPKSEKEKISITITPDVGHILPKNRHAWSLGGHSVYGNPKEIVHAGNRTSMDEILDLRTKSPYTPVGSNLEITLVPQTSSASQNRGKKPQMSVPAPSRPSQPQRLYQPQPSQRPVQKPVLKVPSPVTNVSNGRGSNIVPSVSISVNQDKRKSKVPAAHSTQNFPNFKPGSYSFMDPVYLSALYGGLFTPFSPASSPQQLQMYKELLHRQNIPDSFPRLLQDGSTSISLVNQTPTPPSK